MNIKILSLTLKNFKGIRNLEIIPNEHNVEIYGENETGKTTIADAFHWVLFGKDSLDRHDFDIKTLDEDNNVLHGLEHSVTIVIKSDSTTIKLQRIYEESWVKKRGEAERQLTGHTTNYFIDDVPLKKKEYEAFISEIVDESQFKLLTNVLYFNTVVHWKERRKILLNICGDISDEMVISSDKKLSELKSIISNTTVENVRKRIASQKKVINASLADIPVRIDEIDNSRPKIIDVSLHEERKEKLLKNVSEIDGDIEEIDLSILGITNIQTKWNIKNKKLMDKKSELSDLEFKIKNEYNKEIEEKKLIESRFKRKIEASEKELNYLKGRIKSSTIELEEANTKTSELRLKWADENDRKPNIPDDFNCPTCNQILPEEMKEKKLETLVGIFTEEKKRNLAKISSNGKDCKSEITVLKKDIAKNKSLFKKEKTILDDLKENIESDENSFNIDDMVKVDVTKNKEYIIIVAEIEKLVKDLGEVEELEEKNNLLEKKKILNETKATILETINEINKTLLNNDQIASINDRIKVLIKKERELAQSLLKLENQEFMTELFIKTKVAMLSSKIDSRFKTVKFKMFNQLVNGALEETCETLINGVPYSSANNAAKINSGIDIINTLSGYYDLYAPIIIDNAESINNLAFTRSQLISLYVSEDRQLKIKIKKEA